MTAVQKAVILRKPLLSKDETRDLIKKQMKKFGEKNVTVCKPSRRRKIR